SLTVCLAPANTIGYPQGGGHLWVYLNWALALRAAGCRVIWLEGVDDAAGDSSVARRRRWRGRDVRECVAALKAHLGPYGLADALALYAIDGAPLPDDLAAAGLSLTAGCAGTTRRRPCSSTSGRWCAPKRQRRLRPSRIGGAGRSSSRARRSRTRSGSPTSSTPSSRPARPRGSSWPCAWANSTPNGASGSARWAGACARHGTSAPRPSSIAPTSSRRAANSAASSPTASSS